MPTQGEQFLTREHELNTQAIQNLLDGRQDRDRLRSGKDDPYGVALLVHDQCTAVATCRHARGYNAVHKCKHSLLSVANLHRRIHLRDLACGQSRRPAHLADRHAQGRFANAPNRPDAWDGRLKWDALFEAGQANIVRWWVLLAKGQALGNVADHVVGRSAVLPAWLDNWGAQFTVWPA